MRAVELGAHHDVLRRDAHESSERCGTLCKERGDTAVQDAKGLVHLRSNFYAKDVFIGRDAHRLDAELFIHVRPVKGSEWVVAHGASVGSR